MIVQLCYSYNDFDPFNSYFRHLELSLSLFTAIQTSHILQTIQVTRRNVEYISYLETSNWHLDQSHCILQAFSFPLFLFLPNITVKYMHKHLAWRIHKSRMERFYGRTSRLFFALSTHSSILESLCFVWTVAYSISIMSSVHGWLTTSKTFTCTKSRSNIGLCVKHGNSHLGKVIQCHRSWVIFA